MSNEHVHPAFQGALADAKSVNFRVDRIDCDLIAKISRRAYQIARDFGRRVKAQDFAMDVTATHANGCPLRLEALLEADDFNFIHDVFGIERPLDRETGQLTNCFRPRFARRAESAAGIDPGAHPGSAS